MLFIVNLMYGELNVVFMYVLVLELFTNSKMI